MSSEPVVWVIGEKNTNADKSIDWDSKFSNLVDPDIVIVNLSSLTTDVLERIDKSKFEQARLDLHDKFLGGGKIIFITASFIDYSNPTVYSNYDLAPVHFQTTDVLEANKINFDEKNNEFGPYLKEIGNFNFYLDSIRATYQLAWRMKKSREEDIPFMNSSQYNVKDKSGHTIGCSLSIKGQDGIAIFLPPSSKLSGQDSINKILECLGKSTVDEVIPDWALKISLPDVNNIESNIKQLKSQMNITQQKIEQLQSEKKKIQNHLRLLYCKSTPLENAVIEAFKLLGFDEIRKIREPNKEDWVFEFKHEKQFKYGIIEVKGSDTRTKQGDIVQSSKWVDERFAIDKSVSKGIFIPNQHRTKEYSKSKKDKMHFEPNELQYTQMKSICIIPSFVLFEAVKDILDGKKKSRKDIEKLIASSNNVITKF